MIDRQKLLDMMDGDPDLVQKFLDAFKSQVTTQLPWMQEYLTTGNRPLLSNTAHVMKTQTAYLGLDDLTALAQMIEHMVDAGDDLEEVRPHVTLLVEKLNKVIQSDLD